MPGTISGIAPPREGNLQFLRNEAMAEWRSFLQAAAENFKKGLTKVAGAGIIPSQNRGKKKTHQKEALCN